MQDWYARPQSLESSLKQKRIEKTNKNTPAHINIQPKVPIEPIERLAERLKQVFLDPQVGEPFRFLFRAAQSNSLVFFEPKQETLFLQLVLSEAYARAEKAMRDRG